MIERTCEILLGALLILLSMVLAAYAARTSTPSPTWTPAPTWTITPTVTAPPGCQTKVYPIVHEAMCFSGNTSPQFPNGTWNDGKPGYTYCTEDGDGNLEISVGNNPSLSYDVGNNALSFAPEVPAAGWQVSSIVLRLYATQVLDWAHLYATACGWSPMPLAYDWVACLPDCVEHWFVPGTDAFVRSLDLINAPGPVDFTLTIPPNFGVTPATLLCGLTPMAPPPITGALPLWDWITFVNAYHAQLWNYPPPQLLVTECPSPHVPVAETPCPASCTVHGSLTVEQP